MIALIFSWFFFLHPVHVSVSEINFSEKDKALQITSRIFVDDLELAIRAKRNQPELDILLPPAGITTDQLVAEYLATHFKAKVDGKAQVIKLLGHEREDVAIICYIEIKNIKKFKTLEVTNDVIMDIHNDQSNLVHVTYKGPIKSARLTKEKPTEVFRFDEK